MCVNTVTKSAFNETLCAGVEFDCRLLFVLFLSTPKGTITKQEQWQTKCISRRQTVSTLEHTFPHGETKWWQVDQTARKGKARWRPHIHCWTQTFCVQWTLPSLTPQSISAHFRTWKKNLSGSHVQLLVRSVVQFSHLWLIPIPFIQLYQPH